MAESEEDMWDTEYKVSECIYRRKELLLKGPEPTAANRDGAHRNNQIRKQLLDFWQKEQKKRKKKKRKAQSRYHPGS